MPGFKAFWTDRAVRRALPALAASAIGILAMISAVAMNRPAGSLSYLIPITVASVNLYLVRAIYVSEKDSTTEVIIAGIFILALFSLMGGLGWVFIALHLAWWIYAVVGVILASIAVLVLSGALRKKYRGGPHYFLTFGIILRPIRLVEPISKTEAEAREKEGIVYYIGYFDDSGNPLTVEKRRNGKTDYKYTYSYENGKLVRYTMVKSAFEDGRPAHWRKTPAGSWVRVADQSDW